MCRFRVFAALSLLMLMSASPARAASITFASQSVLPGESLRIEIFGSELLDVFAFGFDPAFDPTVLAFVGAEEGTFLSKAGATSFFVCPSVDCPLDPPSVLAAVSGSDNGVSSLPSQSELLATLLFTAIAAGDPAFQLNPRLLDATFADIPFAFDPGTIAAVPEPSTLALLGVGLAALARKRLRRKSERPV